MHISQFTTQRPVATSMFFLAVVLIGFVSMARLPVDLLPNISFPKLVIWTAYRDAGPSEIEEFITRKIEETVATMPGVRRIRSTSRSSASLVHVEMAWGTDIDFATLALREKLDNLRHTALPENAEKSVILRTDPSAKPIITLAVTGEGNQDAHFELAREVFRRRLEQISGVAMATVTGGRKREIHVEIDMEKAHTLDISIAQIEAALRTANDSRPGGSIRKGRYRYALRTVGEFSSLQDIGATVVFTGTEQQTPVFLRDIATISDTFQQRTGATRYNGKPAVGVLITKEAGANTVEVAERVLTAMAQLQKHYPKVSLRVVDNQAEFITESIAQVQQALLVGGALAFFVLFFFMRDVRNPVNIAISMPISVIATFTLMYFFDVSLNMISLGGLALGIGMLVDNSIVVLENIFRRRQEGLAFPTAAIEGTREVTMPIIASTLTTIAVFFPILYMEGVAGQLFRDQSLTVSFSLLCSLVVALALLPMFAAQWRGTDAVNQTKIEMPKGPKNAQWFLKITQMLPGFISHFFKGLLNYWWRALAKVFSFLFNPVFSRFEHAFNQLSQTYETVLKKALDHPRRTLLFTTAIFLLALLLGLRIDRKLMPEVDQGAFMVDITLPAGTRLEATQALTENVEKKLLEDAAVSAVFSRIGEIAETTQALHSRQGSHFAELTVFVQNGAKTRSVSQRLRPQLSALHARAISLRPAATSISEVLGAVDADLSVLVRSNDTEAANTLVETLKQRIAKIAGVSQCISENEEKQPALHMHIDRRKASQAGADISAIAQHIRNFLHGALPTDFKSFDRKIPILVRADAGSREDINALLQSRINIGSLFMPVSAFVSVEQTLAPAAIERENQVRQQRLLVSIGGRSHFAVNRDIEALIAEMELPQDVEIAFGGQRNEMQRSFRELVFAFLFAFVLVFMILAAQFESLLLPFIIIFSIPLALIGVVAGLLVTGHSFNVMSLIGIVVLVGIVVNDAIVKVDFIRQERMRGTELRQAILLAGQKRLRPIVMTTLTTVLGLLPMALGFGSGAALRKPLAIAVIFGLSFATVLILVVVPVLYLRFERK